MTLIKAGVFQIMSNNLIEVSNTVSLSKDLPFVFIGGPCQLESIDHALMICDFLVNLCNKLGIPYIFKASFDKANRSSINGIRGIGLEKSIEIFQKIKEEFGCPIVTDIHNKEQCEKIGSIVDILQIPAFLCRQTDLIEAAAEYGKIVNIKKGQFLAPWDMKNAVEKANFFGNNNVCLTERGTSFGYNKLIVDIRGLDIMKETTGGVPIIMDATHAVQEPCGMGNCSGGDRKFVQNLARAAVASTKIASVFCEVHQDPDNAPSDGPNTLNFKMTEELLPILKEFDGITKSL